MSLPEHLHQLESADLVRLAQARPEVEYLFRHILVQDAVYSVMLIGERRRLHEAVGRALERAYEDRPQEIATILGRHFDAAGDDERAFHYYTLGGDASARVYANEEAIQLYGYALEISQRNPSFANSEQLRHLYLRRGRALELSLRYDAALQNYEAMAEEGRRRGDPTLELASLQASTTIRATNNPAFQPQEAAHLAEKAIALARQLGDQAAEAHILWNLQLLHIWTGRPHQALEYGNQALVLARQFNLTTLEASILHDLWFVYMITDQVKENRSALQEGRRLLRQLGNLPLLIENLGRSAMTLLGYGEYDEAIILAEEAVHLAHQSNNIEGSSVALSRIGVAYLEKGLVDQAIHIFEEAVTTCEQAKNVLPLVASSVEFALLYGQLGAFSLAASLAALAQERAGDRFPITRSWAAAAQVELSLMQGDLAGAEAAAAHLGDYQMVKQRLGFAPAWCRIGLAAARLALALNQVDKAIALLDNLEADLAAGNMRLFLTDALLLKAQAHLAHQPSEPEAVRPFLLAAYQMAEDTGSRFKQWQILAALANVEERSHHPAEAATLRSQARHLIYTIANLISDPALRASFLNTPAVR